MVCWHKTQLMNPFPDCFSRFKFMKISIEHLFFVCYNVLVAYPFAQKYFVKGVTLGGVKG